MVTNPASLSDVLTLGVEGHGFGINRLPFAFLFCDRNFTIREWNPAAEKMLGYSRGEALGKHALGLLLPGPMPDRLREVVRRIWTGDLNAHSVNRNRTKSGRLILCDWFNTPTYDRDGKVTGVVSIGQDITNRTLGEAMLSATRQVFQESFGSAQIAVLLVEDGGLFADANPAACELSGYSREEIHGLDAESIASGLYEGEQVTSRPNCGQCLMIRKDGRAQKLEFAYVPNVLPGVRLCVIRRMAHNDSAIGVASLPTTGGVTTAQDRAQDARSIDASGFEMISKAIACAAVFCNKLIPRPAAQELGGENGSHQPTSARLTSRQSQVLQLIAEGYKTKQIATELGLSIKTIELHRAQLMKAVSIHDVPGLVRFAIRLGIVSSD